MFEPCSPLPFAATDKLHLCVHFNIPTLCEPPRVSGGAATGRVVKGVLDSSSTNRRGPPPRTPLEEGSPEPKTNMLKQTNQVNPIKL